MASAGNKKPPKGSIGSRATGKRSGTSRLVPTRSSGSKLPGPKRSKGKKLTDRDIRRRENRAVALITWSSLFVFLVLSASLTAYHSHAFLSGDKPEATVPEVVGMSYNQAAVVAEEAGLVLRIRKEDFSDDTEVDFIIDQSPAAGARVKVDREVLVDVSLGSRTLTTPNVIQLERDQAVQDLDNMGVRYHITPQYSDNAAAGVVINQSPPSGTPIAIGEVVSLIVSAGPLTSAIEMPDIEGIPYETAIGIIRDSHLALRRVSWSYIPGADYVAVASQYPIAGTQVMYGSEVLLTLAAPTSMQSLGRRNFRVKVDVPESVGTVRVRITVQDRYETREAYSEEHTGPATVEQLVESYGRTTVNVFFGTTRIREESF